MKAGLGKHMKSLGMQSVNSARVGRHSIVENEKRNPNRKRNDRQPCEKKG